jgi:hypothetical protein
MKGINKRKNKMNDEGMEKFQWAVPQLFRISITASCEQSNVPSGSIKGGQGQ